MLPGPPKIQIPVPEPRLLAHRSPFIDLEGQRCRRVENLQIPDDNLHLAGGDVQIHVLLRTRINDTRDLNAELVAQIVNPGGFQVLVPDDHLADPAGTRRSMNATPPWSRRFATHPAR